LHYLLKERVQSAPRTSKEPALHSFLFFNCCSIIFLNAVSFCFACVT
jgi:hypothetical protein